ncbi:hypothetical protein [uncultured Arcticibacterium sp.]|uniref:hypothetical protein n=1 Tax=uncultured Arcticibacterium sp. TaxID=2173042 RepID=UPI0030F7FE5B
MADFERAKMSFAKLSASDLITQVSFDVKLNGKTFRTIIDGVSFDKSIGKYVLHEAKFGKGILSKNQKALLCALLNLTDTAVQISMIAGSGTKGEQIFQREHKGLVDIKNYIDSDMKVYKETGIGSKTDADFDPSKCGSL